MSTINTNDSNACTRIPLQQWIEGMNQRQIFARSMAGVEGERQRREIMLCKTTIAYGLAGLLRHARSHCGTDARTPASACESIRWCIANFSVRMSMGDISPWRDIKGVDMLSPGLSAHIREPPFLSLCSAAEHEDQMGRYLEVVFPSQLGDVEGAMAAVSQSEEDERCQALGGILYELFVGHCSDESKQCDSTQEPVHKKSRTRTGLPATITSNMSSGRFPRSVEEPQQEQHLDAQSTRYTPLAELGFPSSISLVVQNLLECGLDHRPDDAYDSLDEVVKDLHLMLLDPIRFLFDREIPPDNKRMQLSFRAEKLYGREREVALITDAFCRVSTGKNEALFVKGFSGSGKSRLVNSLTARVDISGGYVLTHKFDQMSKERCLSEVVAVFNDLCLLIREKRTEQDLSTLNNRITEIFGSDFPMLAQLLPGIHALSPPRQNAEAERGDGIRLNLRSVCFILQRFMRAVSSKTNPVMLFLDDLQWCCEKSALTLIEALLCDPNESSCFFFVGSYRDNEVDEDHDLFRLNDSLRSRGVLNNNVGLEGLQPDDLNNLISDSVGLFPRISEPLSDIVFQKTKGNPFFVLQFLRTLLDRGLLKYSICKRRWLWDEESISSMDIMGNVVCLLTSKMIGLSDIIQTTLKVASCFGIKIQEAIVEYLSTTSEYSGIRDGMQKVVKEGFMVKAGTSFRFSHDKIREAAYSLIQESEKKEHHHHLGMALYRIKGSSVDNIDFCIADQLNKGELSKQCPKLKINLAELNMNAGVKAMGIHDYVSARSYFETTLSLLPDDHWEHHYDLSLHSYFLLAKSAYSCGNASKSYDVLQNVLQSASCLMHKLDSYLLLVAILYYRGELKRAYSKNCEILLQLDEKIPMDFDTGDRQEIMKSTSALLLGLSEDSLLRMKKMEPKEQFVLQFYGNISIVAFLTNADVMPYITCRMVQLSMTRGICKYSLFGLVQYAAMCCLQSTSDGIEEGLKIGKFAMSVIDQFDSATDQKPKLAFVYHAVVAIYSEPIQSSVDSLRRGFELGMAIGDTHSGLINATFHIRKALIAGSNLPTLLTRNDYYLEVAKMHNNKMAIERFLAFENTIKTLMITGYNVSSKEADNHPGTFFHKAVRAFWIGHHERSQHFVQKVVHGSVSGYYYRNHRVMVMLYFGINSLRIKRKAGGLKRREITRKALKTLKTAAYHSEWNFDNKFHLLKAEIFSSEERNEEAKASYDAAIASAQHSKFIHEQGLACELAGFHHKKIGDFTAACRLFNEAKQCYENWGSQMKVHSVTCQLEKIQV